MNNICCGPGYASPKDAMQAPREKLLYTIAIYVSPSVCEEQRCVGGGSRDRVISLDVVDREYGVVDKSTKTPWWWKTGPEADGFDDDMITNDEFWEVVKQTLEKHDYCCVKNSKNNVIVYF